MPKIRKTPGRPAHTASGATGLSREQVVAEALNVLRTDGLSGLTTRRVATRLNVMSPALYWHVRNKDELLQLVADAICAEMVLPRKEWSFRKRLATIANEYRRVLIAYRDGARLFAEQPPTGPHRMKLYDAAVEAFFDAGFQVSEAIAMATFYRHYLLGMVTEETRGHAKEPGSVVFPVATLGVELQHLGMKSAEYPSLAHAAAQLGKIQPEALFTAGLKVILDGLEFRKAELNRRKAR
ncbi:MAG TPA: TetR/AcrR family transcriptional regulator C-terminal domain-containing protein [Rhodanobacteraceae bacterium]